MPTFLELTEDDGQGEEKKILVNFDLVTHFHKRIARGTVLELYREQVIWVLEEPKEIVEMLKALRPNT